MSITEKQLEANRQNAQKSTGPNTNEGKKSSSRNAIKHGLHATDIVFTTRSLQRKVNLTKRTQIHAFLTQKYSTAFASHDYYRDAGISMPFFPAAAGNPAGAYMDKM